MLVGARGICLSQNPGGVPTNAGLVPITWETFCSSFLNSITTLKLKCIFLLEVQTSKCF